jgi:hypothetical protein
VIIARIQASAESEHKRVQSLKGYGDKTMVLTKEILEISESHLNKMNKNMDSVLKKTQAFGEHWEKDWEGVRKILEEDYKEEVEWLKDEFGGKDDPWKLVGKGFDGQGVGMLGGSEESELADSSESEESFDELKVLAELEEFGNPK